MSDQKLGEGEREREKERERERERDRERERERERESKSKEECVFSYIGSQSYCRKLSLAAMQINFQK